MVSDPDEPRRDVDVAEGTSAGSQNAWRSGDGDVVVPVELYKIVTVFSTLIAVAFVVFGFLFIDAATGAVRRVALLGWAIGLGLPIACYLGYLSVRADAGTLERLFVLFGLFALSVATVPGAVRRVLEAASLTDGQFQVVFGVAGVTLIGVGAGVYILGTRFRTAGMGNPKDDAD